MNSPGSLSFRFNIPTTSSQRHPALSFATSKQGRLVLRGLTGAFVASGGLASLSVGDPRRFLGLGNTKARQLRSLGRTVRTHSQQGSSTEFGSPRRRVTDVLLGLNIAFYIAQFATGDRLTLWGAKVNSAIHAGQWWRLLTPALLHGNILHLVSNNYALQNLGPTVEAFSGRPRFLAVYIISALTGTLASYRMSTAPSVGASGAIFGLGGALAVFFYRHKNIFGGQSDDILRQLGQNLAINTIMGLSVPRVDNWGHLGGLIGGALASYLLGPRLVVVTTGNGKKTQRFLSDRPLVPIFAQKGGIALS